LIGTAHQHHYLVVPGYQRRNEYQVRAYAYSIGDHVAAGGGKVAAQANETLQSVSQRVHGDALCALRF